MQPLFRSLIRNPFHSKKQIFIWLLLLDAACSVVAMMGYYVTYHDLRQPLLLMLNSHITALLSLPKSFGDTLHLTDPANVRDAGWLILAFWLMAIASLVHVFKTRSKRGFLILTPLMLLASYGWWRVSMLLMYGV